MIYDCIFCVVVITIFDALDSGFTLTSTLIEN